MFAYVDYLNATGGINGRSVRLVSHDSGSQPEQALAVFKRIMTEEEKRGRVLRRLDRARAAVRVRGQRALPGF